MKTKSAYAQSQLKIRGCIIGGAAGDALGYPIEFESEDYIYSKYGDVGMTHYKLSGGKALVSDDTQMTLFTAVGMLKQTYAVVTGKDKKPDVDYTEAVARAYGDWYFTQTHSWKDAKRAIADGSFEPLTWLSYVPELYNCRAPGNTCISAIIGGCRGTMQKPVNNSKGCGGVMRVAPVGLMLPGDPLKAALVGASLAALTHGHRLGYLPAAVLAYMISLLSSGSVPSIQEAVRLAVRDVAEHFGRCNDMLQLENLLSNAVKLSDMYSLSDIDCVRMLGEGWVADEALAVAIFCAIRYQDDFERALAVAVSHGGDSDSTGAITGNVLGAFRGITAIPEHLISRLEMLDVLLDVSDDIFLLGASPRHALTDPVARVLYDRYGFDLHPVYNPGNKI